MHGPPVIPGLAQPPTLSFRGSRSESPESILRHPSSLRGVYDEAIQNDVCPGAALIAPLDCRVGLAPSSQWRRWCVEAGAARPRHGPRVTRPSRPFRASSPCDIPSPTPRLRRRKRKGTLPVWCRSRILMNWRNGWKTSRQRSLWSSRCAPPCASFQWWI